MDQEAQILAKLGQEGIGQPNRPYRRNDIKEVLDKLAVKSLPVPEFSHPLAQQLFDNTEFHPAQHYKPQGLARTMVESIGILKRRLLISEEELKQTIDLGEHGKERRKELVRENWISYEDYKMLTVPFGIQDEDICPGIEEEGLRNDLKVGYVGEMFDQEQESGKESQKMAVVLVVVLVSLVLEMLAMFARHHFLTSLTLLQTASIILLGYFDKHSVVLTLILNATSIVLNFIWLFFMATPLFSPIRPSHRTHSGFLLVYSFFVTILLILVHFYLLYIFYPYRQTTRHDQLTVRLCGFVFRLNGAAKSPVCTKVRQMEEWGE